MNKQQIFHEISLILKELQESNQSPDWDTVLIGKGGILDSLTAYRFITAVESKFQIEMDDEDINFDNLSTIGTLVDYISELV